MWSRRHWDNCVRGGDWSRPPEHPASTLERNLPLSIPYYIDCQPESVAIQQQTKQNKGETNQGKQQKRKRRKERKKREEKRRKEKIMGIVHGTLDTGVGWAASCRACRSSLFLRSSSRQLALNRTASCFTIPHTWSLHAACNQPSSGIPNAFQSSFRHSH